MATDEQQQGRPDDERESTGEAADSAARPKREPGREWGAGYGGGYGRSGDYGEDGGTGTWDGQEAGAPAHPHPKDDAGERRDTPDRADGSDVRRND